MPAKPAPILVGVSTSASSDAALRWAVEQATTRELLLRLIHIYQWQPVVPGSPLYSMIYGTHEPPELRQRAAEILARATDLAHAQNPALDLDGEVLEGDRTEVLRAESRRAAMLVLGSRPRHTWRGIQYRPVRALPTGVTVPMVITRTTAAPPGAAVTRPCMFWFAIAAARTPRRPPGSTKSPGSATPPAWTLPTPRR